MITVAAKRKRSYSHFFCHIGFCCAKINTSTIPIRMSLPACNHSMMIISTMCQRLSNSAKRWPIVDIIIVLTTHQIHATSQSTLAKVEALGWAIRSQTFQHALHNMKQQQDQMQARIIVRLLLLLPIVVLRDKPSMFNGRLADT